MMKEGYIKNPTGYYLIMIAVAIICMISAYYHWSLVVIRLIALRINITNTTVYYSLVVFVGFPILYWVLGTRNARQFSISNQIKNLSKEGNGNLWLSLKSIFKRAVPRKTAKKMVKGDTRYHRILSILILVGAYLLMICFQYYILSFVHWRRNIELWRVLLWDSGIASLNAIMVVILASVAYKLKSRRIPSNYIQKT